MVLPEWKGELAASLVGTWALLIKRLMKLLAERLV